MSEAGYYRARGAEIIDQDGRQIAVVVPSNTTKRAARQMAAYCAQQMNHEARQRERVAARAAKEQSNDDCR